MDALPCIACGHELKQAIESEDTNQPMRATCFTAGGQYGSTVFDPMNGDYLEINVCDTCLLQRQHRVLHHKAGDRGKKGTIWNPRSEDNG